MVARASAKGIVVLSLLAVPSAIIALAAQGEIPSDAEITHLAQALLDAAYATEDPAEIAAVARAVKTVFPDYADAIDAQSGARIAALEAEAAAAAGDVDGPDAGPTLAEDAPAASGGLFALNPWEGKIQAGGAWTDGNSDNLTASFGLDASRPQGAFVHNVTLYFDLAESDGETDQKRWGGSYQLDYDFNRRTYAYARFSYDEDDFSGFDYRLFAGGGLGHYLARGKPLNWKVEAGPGFRYSPIDDTNEIESELAVYASSETDWVIIDGFIFEQDLNVTWTSPTTTFQSISAFRTEITDSFSTALSFELRYETDPPFGRVNTDTIARASLAYGF